MVSTSLLNISKAVSHVCDQVNSMWPQIDTWELVSAIFDNNMWRLCSNPIKFWSVFWILAVSDVWSILFSVIMAKHRFFLQFLIPATHIRLLQIRFLVISTRSLQRPIFSVPFLLMLHVQFCFPWTPLDYHLYLHVLGGTPLMRYLWLFEFPLALYLALKHLL